MDDLVYFCMAVEARDQNGALIATASHTKKYIHFNTESFPHFWNTIYLWTLKDTFYVYNKNSKKKNK